VTWQEWFFTALAVLGLGAAIRLVTAKNVVHAALFLVGSLASIAAMYLLLGAEFLAWVQVLIYVGAIVVLLLFGLMLTRAPIGREALDNQQRGLALIVSLGVLIGLIFIVQTAFGGQEIELARTTTAEAGESLFTNYVMPFEVVSFLLLAALIGAIVLARREEP
jgi:NADH-quinone oxidoreductase subunit J